MSLGGVRTGWDDLMRSHDVDEMDFPASTPWDLGITIRIPFTFLPPAPFHSFATLYYPSLAIQQNPFPLIHPGNTSPNTVQYVYPLY
jgi:hypothetical protein